MVAASSAGHSGAASATWEHVHRHFAVAALFVARNAACTSGGPKIDSHVDFDSTAAWRHHVSMPPSSRSQSAATTALTAGICELFRVKRLREIPHWWILGRCGPPTERESVSDERRHFVFIFIVPSSHSRKCNDARCLELCAPCETLTTARGLSPLPPPFRSLRSISRTHSAARRSWLARETPRRQLLPRRLSCTCASPALTPEKGAPRSTSLR